MKTRLLIVLLFVSFYSFSQTATDSSLTEQYCLVRIYSLSLTNKVEVVADYGFTKNNRRKLVLKDEQGKRRSFISEADALNFFGSEGWKLVNAFPVSEYRDNYTRYIFKRSSPISEIDPNN